MFNGNYKQFELPPELFNNIGQTTYNGTTYNVSNKGDGTRDISPVNGGGNTSNSGSNSTPSDPLALAGSLQSMQVQANQPAIATLGSQQSSLKDQYSKLLDSVLGQGTVASNYSIKASNSALAQRGITSDSQLGEQTIADNLLPVTAQNQSAAAQVGQGSAQDINTLAGEIAGLQAGNVQGAIGAAPAIAGLAALPSQIALAGSQAGASGAQGRYIPIPNVGVYDVQAGHLIGNISNNNLSTGGFQILNVGQ